MPGARSVYFDGDSEAIILEFQEEFHHRTFSAAIQALVKDHGQLRRNVIAYRAELEELHRGASDGK